MSFSLDLLSDRVFAYSAPSIDVFPSYTRPETGVLEAVVAVGG